MSRNVLLSSMRGNTVGWRRRRSPRFRGDLVLIRLSSSRFRAVWPRSLARVLL